MNTMDLNQTFDENGNRIININGTAPISFFALSNILIITRLIQTLTLTPKIWKDLLSLSLLSLILPVWFNNFHDFSILLQIFGNLTVNLELKMLIEEVINLENEVR